MAVSMDMGLELERLKELTLGFTELADKYPFEVGVLLGALGMAVVWLLVSLTSVSRIERNAGKSRSFRDAGSLSVEDVREKAKRRL